MECLLSRWARLVINFQNCRKSSSRGQIRNPVFSSCPSRMFLDSGNSDNGLDLIPATSVGIAVARAIVESEMNVPSSFNLQTLAGRFDRQKSVRLLQ
ncbi:hypothetical protein SAY86_021798 [Trapa natans]|uniref:Uncharacterized protein n=1 Tax=Trapa natans TaxID=22666 RepID=A0AAN7MD49_TRANT|nr:hypothetical protein SAY86_021798 [Trapa natans]